VTAWDEYVTAARRLDAARRAAASVVAEQNAAAQAARDELTGLQSRLALQQARLLDAARREGGAVPELAPSAEEAAAARAALGAGTPASVTAALRSARAAVDTADAVLSGLADSAAAAPTPLPRNALIYGGYALLAGVVQALAFLAVDDASALSVLLLGCGLLLPVPVFGLGWLTVGALSAGRGPGQRTPALGAALSLLALLPMAATAGWLGVSAVLNR
jgi:hypothetical protein